MITATSIAETHAVAADFVSTLTSTDTATVVGLYGDLGAGKTAFVQGIAKALGVDTQVVSPTFVLEKIYTLDPAVQSTFTHLVHIDAYRMDSSVELAHIGWHELLKDPRNLICIEWPERVIEEMPTTHIRIDCSFVDETTHSYDIHTQ